MSIPTKCVCVTWCNIFSMGKVVSVLSKRVFVKPVKDYNLEQRAFKEISKEKRPVAPRHESTTALIDEMVHAQSAETKRKLEVKDDLLLERLRDVYVTSQDVMPKQQIKSSPNRPLPADRTMHVDPEYGYFEPRNVPYGKITLKDAVQVISKHQENPDMWTPQRLSREYRLDLGLTGELE
ncbi:hypothetical protein Pmani_018369 [Petrolisthes manimaculis]|uniref:NADH dehydrogenase [ubiquinone] 1 alpha subcomplex assembly factor 4 n=1 Tax=Petrolisthes manimaculis TaxID=1843537 RepID=A0AAE1PKE1_9EUCA|nr:hypothetical protein Pmani_018369 [Petrolisthes manimaculis]